MTTVYTDGACLGNPGPGGWAWAVPGGASASGSEPATTNQRMEVRAAFEGALALPGPLHVVSDSNYVVKCFNDRWYEGWERRGWRNASKQPIANQDLWRPFVEHYLERGGEITFEWVKGHSGDEMNDLVDRLATDAARSQRAGTPPSPRAASERAATPSGASTPSGGGELTGFRIAVFGHRPPELGGYEPGNPVATRVRSRIEEVLRGWAVVHDDSVVLTGLGLGAEQLAAEACRVAGVPYVAVLPYPDPDKVWPASSRAHFADLLTGASRVITLDAAAPATRQLAGRASGRRDTWITGHADAAILVWDGIDRHLGALAATLEQREADVIFVTPS
ncbi:MAG: RNase H family protein [Acidimicrobiales bacterium]